MPTCGAACARSPTDLPPPGILQPDAIAALGAAGMTIGFHTVEHDTLPDLDDPALEHAVSAGREDLATAAGAAVRYFAYPHGKADTRSAAAVRRAGFNAAFTGRAAAGPARRRSVPLRTLGAGAARSGRPAGRGLPCVSTAPHRRATEMS